VTFFTLVRHGQTSWNLDRRIQGSTDIPLNETGIADARAAAEMLRTETFDAIVASPLVRAHRTAQVIAEELGLDEPLIETDLRERNFGVAEGLGVDEYLQRYGNWHTGVPESETLDVVGARAGRALLRLSARARLQTSPRAPRIIVVTHGGVIRSLLHRASGGTLPHDGESLANGSIHHFLAQPDALHIWNHPAT